jgi:hypothetical protein
MAHKSLKDIHDLLQLSMPAGMIGQWLVSANAQLAGERPIDCMARNRFDEVYEVALAL